jgi:hypothetical protein
MAWNRSFTLASGMVALLATCLAAAAQSYPVPPGAIPGGQQPMCQRLESQLAAIDRGPNDPARAAQISRYEDAVRRQQGELDRTVMRSRQLGCDRVGLFSLFTSQPAECGPLTREVQQMRTTIDRLMTELQRAQGGTADRESRRRSVLIALSENDCGPQYRRATVNRSRGFFESLFAPESTPSPTPSPEVPQQVGGTYRTLCVRTCDGYYWPISFRTVRSRFDEDERTCQRMCPAAQVVLYAHRNPGEDVAQAVSLSGQSYSDMPNAFLYRKQFSPTCSCKRPGETWAHALQHLDEKVERGDIVVTEERAKQLSKPREQQPARSARSGQGTPTANEPPEPKSALRGNVDSGKDKDDKVRNVGPVFLPAERQ